MRLTKSTVITVAFMCCLSAAAIIVILQRKSKPLGEAPIIEFPSSVSQATKAQLLKDDFRIVTDVSALPTPVLKAFQEKGGSRSLLANPGAKFNPTDVIWDASVPRKRLILAGVSTDRCFVHYEQGGRGHSYVIEVFGLRSGETIEPLWFGYCAKTADNLKTPRSQIASGGCS
jgi:hypothetical protein